MKALTDNPKINLSIVVITHNRESMVKRLVDTLKTDAKSYDSGNVEVLIINSSSSSLFDNDNFITEVHVPNIIKASSKRNLGLKYAKYNWIIYIDDDCILKRGSLNTIARYISKYNADSTGGFYGVTKFYGKQKLPFKCCNNTHWTEDFSWALNKKVLLWGPTSIAIFRKDVLNKIGGFDESFEIPVGGEDVDIGIRINRAGYKLYGIPEVLVYHDVSTWNSFWGNIKRFFRYGMGDVFLQLKHPDLVYLKLNSVALIIIAMIILSGLLFLYTKSIIRSISYVPVYILFSFGFSIIYYYYEYKKLFHESIILKLYDLSSEVGRLFASYRKRKLKTMFFLAKYTPYGPKKSVAGRETLLYKEEIPDLMALVVTFIVLAWR
jgi:GT2 family glycosyltransferase